MSLVLPYTLFTGFIWACYLAVRSCTKEKLKYAENRLYLCLCLFSAVWSFGFWGVNIQTDPERAYIFRAIGQFGVFNYLIIAQLLICVMSDIRKKVYIGIAVISVFGYVIFYRVIQKGSVVYKLSSIGMVYRFEPSFWNTVYTLYCVMIAANIFASVCYMLSHAKKKRNVQLAKLLFIVEAIVVAGMMFDTVFPLFGVYSVPGSTVGQFVGLLAMSTAIRFSNRYRITIDNMSTYVYYSLTTPVLVYDSDYCAQIVNDAAHDFMKLRSGDDEGSSIEELFSVEPEEVFRFNGERKDIDVTCSRNGLPCNLSVSKIRDDYYDIIGYIIVVTDLSERMSTVAKLERAINEAKSANQAKTTFLANMSHEIRTPMNAVIGFTELVQKEDISDKVRGYMDGIGLSAKNLLAIINDILDITKIESGKMELVPDQYYFADLLEDVSLIISQQARQKGLAFVMKTDERIPARMYGDKIRIRGVLINILNNAVKYTNEGTVTFETKVVSEKDDDITLAFIVSDTGIGIRREDIGKLFQNFERLDQGVNYGIEGSGLGLSISKSYVTLMGGDISVESEYGVGSVFTVTLGQKVTDHAPMRYDFSFDRHTEDEEGTSRLMVRDTRVLLVDDNTINLMVTKALLNSYGLAVDTASGGKIAVGACKNFHYPIIFMDQMMPGMDGIEAMQEIRKLDDFYKSGNGCRMIVLTANAIRGSREQLMAEGFDEYLGKPLNLRQLERLLIRYLPKDKITVMQPEILEEGGKQPEGGGEDAAWLKEHLDGVDVSMGLKNCGGSMEDYLKILKINYTYGGKHLDELKALLEKKDYDGYTIKIHSIKSTVKGIGAVALSNLAYNQEMAGKSGNFAYLDTHCDAFCLQYEEQLEKIGDALRHYGVLSDGEDRGEKEFDSRMLPNVLLNIREHIDSFDFAGVFDILDEMKKYRLDDAKRALFDRIAALMDELSVDEVRAVIAEELKNSGEPLDGRNGND